jgi:transcriptional regulator with XRE-family HTH domain
MHPKTIRKDHRKPLSRALMLLRKRKDFRRDYLAIKIGISLSSMDKIEQGVTYLRFIDVYMLCKALGVDLHELSVLFERELESVTLLHERNR